MWHLNHVPHPVLLPLLGGISLLSNPGLAYETEVSHDLQQSATYRRASSLWAHTEYSHILWGRSTFALDSVLELTPQAVSSSSALKFQVSLIS